MYDTDHYADAVKHLYQNGAGKGLTTGFACVDELFHDSRAGMLHIVTGVPSMGKSEFVDQMLFNLAATYDWKHAICSFENPPHMHIAKFLEKLRKPFHIGPTQRMSEDEMEDAMEWLRDHFIFHGAERRHFGQLSMIFWSGRRQR